MPLSAKQIYQGAVHHALEKAQKGREREYVLFFVRTMAADLQARRFYSSALVCRQLLAELYDTKKIIALAGKYGLCECCKAKLNYVPLDKSQQKPPNSNTGATPHQMAMIEDYIDGK